MAMDFKVVRPRNSGAANEELGRPAIASDSLLLRSPDCGVISGFARMEGEVRSRP